MFKRIEKRREEKRREEKRREEKRREEKRREEKRREEKRRERDVSVRSRKQNVLAPCRGIDCTLNGPGVFK